MCTKYEPDRLNSLLNEKIDGRTQNGGCTDNQADLDVKHNDTLICFEPKNST